MGAVFDFKKQQRELYAPGATPVIVDVPEMVFLMVDGQGDPNTSSAYTAAVEALYGLSYTVKMSKKGGQIPPGYFDFVVPPLEGLWIADGGVPFTGGQVVRDKASFVWTALIRQPDFVTLEVFTWAKDALAVRKPQVDTSGVRLECWTEGLCAQVLHVGSYDDEPGTVAALDRFMEVEGFTPDFTGSRRHHEIYLSDPRKTAPSTLRTIIRHPVFRQP